MAAALLLLAIRLGGVAPTEPLRWTDFAWHAVDANGQRLDKAALLVRTTIVGLPGTHALQLDTGSHLNYLHAGAVADVDPAYAAALGRHAWLTGETAGTSTTELFTVLADYRAIFTQGEPTPIIGTLGLPFLEGRVLIIDYPRARLAVRDASS